MPRVRIAVFVLVAVICTSVFAQDWPNEPIIKHSIYQAVNGDGTSAYAGGFPLRLRGVLLNNPEDWLDATFQPNPGSGNFNLGAEWEVFVQAVDLDGTAYDPDPGSAFDDFGGTAAYMAQNYAGLPWVPGLTYSQTQWTTELDRVNYAGGTPGTDPAIRAGDLVEIRARGGLNFQGKRNVNEQHDTNPSLDFEIVLLEQGFGRPAAQPLTLDTFKDSSNQYIFDDSRQTGGERYQCTWLELRNVMLVDNTGWAPGAELELMDATGRTLPIELGLNPSFATTAAPEGWFNVSGIVNQGGSDTGGYYLLALEAGDFVVPEPASLMLLAGCGVLIAFRRNRGRM